MVPGWPAQPTEADILQGARIRREGARRGSGRSPKKPQLVLREGFGRDHPMTGRSCHGRIDQRSADAPIATFDTGVGCRLCQHVAANETGRAQTQQRHSRIL